jgi:hypothetical protein
LLTDHRHPAPLASVEPIEASSFYTTVQDATDHRGQVTSIANSQLNTYDLLLAPTRPAAGFGPV